MTQLELGAALNFNNGQFGRVMIMAVNSYYGWHDREMWSWIALKAAQ